jgi:hypothetical protein
LLGVSKEVFARFVVGYAPNVGVIVGIPGEITDSATGSIDSSSAGCLMEPRTCHKQETPSIDHPSEEE